MLYENPTALIRRLWRHRRNKLLHHHLEEGRSVFKVVAPTPTEERHLGRPRLRWEDNIRMDLGEIGISAGNWVDLPQDRNYWKALVNAALNLRAP